MITYLAQCIHATFKAGEEIMDVYQSSNLRVELKSDQSPLTEADKRAHKAILESLSQTNIPFLSEEGVQMTYAERKKWKRFWLIDPLDGTKEFIKRNGEFTVNIALIEDGVPILGVVYVPEKNTLYFGSSEIGSYKLIIEQKEPLHGDIQDWINKACKLEQKKADCLYTVVASRSHLSPETEQFIDEKKKLHGEVKIISAGSSLKLCLVAEGIADVYPRLAPTMEWDTAAGHAIAKFSGCQVYDFDTKQELHYNKEDLHNPWFVVERVPTSLGQ